jgi:hypothetical protein
MIAVSQIGPTAMDSAVATEVVAGGQKSEILDFKFAAH